jgi:hypothetical protein
VRAREAEAILSRHVFLIPGSIHLVAPTVAAP